jgi:hypothetical protein
MFPGNSSQSSGMTLELASETRDTTHLAVEEVLSELSALLACPSIIRHTLLTLPAFQNIIRLCRVLV